MFSKAHASANWEIVENSQRVKNVKMWIIQEVTAKSLQYTLLGKYTKFAICKQ